MGALEVTRLGYRLPGGRQLLDDVSFRVGDGEHVALVGANGVGKTTLLRIVAGEERPTAGTVHVDGRLGVMRQMVVGGDDRRTVRDLLVSFSPPAVREAAARLAAAEAAAARDGSAETGMRLAAAWTAWADAGGFDAEVHWDACCTAVLRQGLADAGDRPAATLSGGEQKRLALEVLLRGDDDVLLLDEPDNFLDVPGKEWLEEALRASAKTIVLVSHDRQLLAEAASKVVTVEGRGAWTHGGSFATWHDARQARLERLDEEHRRWREQRKSLEDQLRELRRRSQVTDAFASRLRATKTRIARHEAAAPRERPKDQSVAIRLEGGRTGKRAVVVEDLALPGLVEPFSTEIWFQERVGVLGLNGTGKSHLLRLLAGEGIPHEGSFRLGANVVPGHFSQLHRRDDLRGRRLVDVLGAEGLPRGQAMAALRRYELHEAAEQPFETLSGGQQARVQILLLELAGATLLLLDEPTDNLDLASAEALEDALGTYTGTVVAVTHDRWFMRSFDRFLVLGRDGTVAETLEPAWG